MNDYKIKFNGSPKPTIGVELELFTLDKEKIAILETNFKEIKSHIEKLSEKINNIEALNQGKSESALEISTSKFIPYVNEQSVYTSITNKIFNKSPPPQKKSSQVYPAASPHSVSRHTSYMIYIYDLYMIIYYLNDNDIYK